MIVPFRAKYISFGESTEKLYIMTLKSDAKVEEKMTGGLRNGMRNLAKFSPDHLKASKLGLLWDLSVQNRKCMR